MRSEVRELTKDDPLLAEFVDVPAFKATTRVWAGFWDGELAAIWGIAPNSAISDTAFIWSIGYPPLAKCRRQLLLVARFWLKAMSDEFTDLVGVCDKSTALVKHLGGVFGNKSGDFYPFAIKV